MKVAFIIAGVSGSGKSTFVNKLVASELFIGKKIFHFSLDKCRYSLYEKNVGSSLEEGVDNYAKCFAYANDNASAFNQEVNDQWNLALKHEVVIVDNTNLTKKSRNRWTTEARSKWFTVYGVQVFAPLQTVINRQKSRGDKSVPESVIRTMYMSQQEMLVGTEVDMLFNIDGTVHTSNITSTLHFA